MAGFLKLASRFEPGLDIFEIGASAGLNMAFDQYFYQTDRCQRGDPDSSVSLEPNCDGAAPLFGPLKIHRRNACDLSPIDIDSQSNRLLSCLWPDQLERLERAKGKLNYAAKSSLGV